MIGKFSGTKIYWDMNALEETKERMFPVSKHRSKRIHKKLLKRFGGEFRKQPCIWKTPRGIFAHPSFKAEIERQIEGRV